MLTFYYHPLSPIARRVWLALLEKDIPFEPVIIDPTAKEQFKPEFLQLNPFHHVPVITQGDFRLVESLAILDYLEEKYPSPSLSPDTPEERATMKMVQLVTANELLPQLPTLILAEGQVAGESLATVLRFLNDGLAGRPYYGGEGINLADIVVGAAVPLCRRLGLSLKPYPALGAWCDRITARPAWQTSSPGDAELEAWRQYLQRWIRAKRKRQTRADR